jgi:predicted RNase H-like HicB family nuclease
MEEKMLIILKQEIYQIKNGFAAHSPELGMTAHGYSPDVARRNLERVALMFLKPFERLGVLEKEIKFLGLKTQGNNGELAVTTSEIDHAE